MDQWLPPDWSVFGADNLQNSSGSKQLCKPTNALRQTCLFLTRSDSAAAAPSRGHTGRGRGHGRRRPAAAQDLVASNAQHPALDLTRGSTYWETMATFSSPGDEVTGAQLQLNGCTASSRPFFRPDPSGRAGLGGRFSRVPCNLEKTMGMVTSSR